MEDASPQIPVFDHAISCELLASAATDLAVVNAARISYDTEHEGLTLGDEKLIDYLLRNKHGSPFEHGYFKFRVEAPIFVFREHHRHRAGHSYNEMSGRYTELEPHFYAPEKWRVQVGKPGSYTFEELPDSAINFNNEILARSYYQSWEAYEKLLNYGIAKEQARMVLPVGIFSKMIWSCNPRSLMHFLSLRNSKQAQAEIRMVAEQAEEALAAAMPITHEAFLRNARIAP